MMKLLFSGCLCLLSLNVFAQEYEAPGRDTLEVTKVIRQMTEVPEEEWPLTEIYRDQFGFKFFGAQLDVVERKEYASAVYFKLNHYNTSDNYEMWAYEMPDNILRLKMGEYQFYCYDEHRTLSYHFFEQRPMFLGGDMNTFAQWISERVVYPAEAKNKGIEGCVRLQFTIDENGDVCKVRVIDAVDPELDKAAFRTVLSSPKWSPAIRDGKPVSFTVTFPVIFQLD